MTEPVPTGITDGSNPAPETKNFSRNISIIVLLALAGGLLAIALIRPWIPDPASIIKESRTRTMIVSSCLMSAVETENLASDTRLTVAQGSYAVPFRSSLQVTRDDVIQEYIHIGQTTYVKGEDDSGPIITEGLLSDLFVRGPQSIITSLGYLRDIERQVDQTVDGVSCFHYTASFMAPEEITGELLEEISAEDYAYLEAMHDRATTTMRLDIWIKKSDKMLHQLRTVVRSKSDRQILTSTTLKLYDYNTEITIEPPLDDNGEVLEGWRIYER